MEMSIEQQKALAVARARLRAKQTGGEKKPEAEPGQQPIDASTVFVDEMLFGLPGKAAAGINALVRAPFTAKTVGEEYDALRSQYQAGREQYAKENPVANTAATIGGAVYGGAATGNLALKGAQAVAPGLMSRLGSGFAGKMAGDATLGAAQGAATAYGHDEDMGTGALVGGAAGAVARPVMALGGSLLNSVGGMVGIGNQGRARTAVAEALARSGKSADDVVDDLTRAAADGQDVYTVADSLGNPGQRMLSGIVRSPGDERAVVVEALQRRQAGQGRRLQTAISEGFGADKTAAARVSALTNARDEAANRAYEMARYGLTPADFDNAVVPANMSMRQYLEQLPKPRVDVRNVVAAIDDRIGPMQGSGVTGDSIDAALSQFRNRLTAPASKLPEGVTAVDLSDFDRVLGVKKDLRDAIEVARRAGQGNRVRELNKIHAALDQALEDASPAYRMANDQFASASRVIDSVETGQNAAMRGRVEDTIPQFRGMTPDQQAAFRTGYADPYIADIQKTAGPMTNRARPLITDATQAEFPAFAKPGKAPQLMDRIAREQTMFETASAALGGSKTADNLADMMDVQSFDPSMLGALATGNFKGAALQGLTKAVQGVQGRNTQTRDLIAKALMTSSPQAAKTVLDQAVKQGQISTEFRNAVVRALIGTTNASVQMAN